MKKIYFLIILLPVIAHAQITINQPDLPNVGWGYINAIDPSYTDPIPPGGASQTWNYSSLQNVTQDSLLFISSVGTPYASSFPNANLATYNPNDSSYGYFISNSSGFALNGGSVAQFNGFVAVYNPPQMILPVPFTMGSTYSGYSRFQIDTVFGTDSARIILNTQIDMIGDGYGSLTLPTGPPISNTLRIKTTSLQTDSIWLKLPVVGWTLSPPTQTQTTDFKWVRNGGGTLLLDIAADSLGQNATQSSYLLIFGIVGIDEINNPATINTYPNPASDNMSFNFKNNLNEPSTLTIFNQIGQEMESYNVTGLNTFTLNTSKLSNGMYSYRIQNEKGIASKGKFLITH